MVIPTDDNHFDQTETSDILVGNVIISANIILFLNFEWQVTLITKS